MEAYDAKPDKKWLKNLPNQLSLYRIAVVPVILLLFPIGFKAVELFAAFLYFTACVTDWLDGFLARRLNLESKLGALLDPIADKMLTGAGLIMIAASGSLWTWMAGFLLCRELAISGVRLMALQQNLTIAVSWMGKVKTFFLDSAIFCLMVNRTIYDIPFREMGMVMIWVTLGLSFYSGWLYAKEFWNKSTF